jgi:hypothetical protein
MALMADHLTKEESQALAARRRKLSIALALVLGGLVVIFYVLTIVKLGSGAAGIAP